MTTSTSSFSTLMRERYDHLFEAFYAHPYLRGLADGAEERPAGAVHRQRQRIDPGTDFRRHRCAAAVAIEGDGEKNGHVDQGDRSDQPG